MKKNKQRQPFNLVNYSQLLRITEMNEKEQLEVFWDIYRKYNPIAESSLPLNKKKLTLHYIVSYAERLFSDDIAPILTVQEDIIITEATKKTMEPPEIFIEAWVRFGPAVIISLCKIKPN